MDGGPWSPFEAGGTASFHHLRARAHRFEVKAMDRNGNVDPNSAFFEFQVLVPWYLHSKFLAISAIGSLMICGLLMLAVVNVRLLRRAKVVAESANRSKSQ